MKPRRTPTVWQLWAEKHKEEVNVEWNVQMRRKGWNPNDKADAKKGFGLWNTVKKELWEKAPRAEQEKYRSKLQRWTSDDLSKMEVRE